MPVIFSLAVACSVTDLTGELSSGADARKWQCFLYGRDWQMKPCEAFEAFSLIVPKQIQYFKASKTDPTSDI